MNLAESVVLVLCRCLKNAQFLTWPYPVMGNDKKLKCDLKIACDL